LINQVLKKILKNIGTNFASMNGRFLDTPYAYFEIEDDILCVTYKHGLSITLDIAKEIVRSRMEFVNNKVYLLLILDNGVKSIDKAARDFLSSERGISHIVAAALVLRSNYSSFLGNFFLKITRPALPVKSFTEKKKALEWLGQFKLKSV
jgi:hypothetical protein